jgi:hypothetical protein
MAQHNLPGEALEGFRYDSSCDELLAFSLCVRVLYHGAVQF